MIFLELDVFDDCFTAIKERSEFARCSWTVPSSKFDRSKSPLELSLLFDDFGHCGGFLFCFVVVFCFYRLMDL